MKCVLCVFKSKMIIITFFLYAPRKTLFDCLILTACGFYLNVYSQEKLYNTDYLYRQ